MITLLTEVATVTVAPEAGGRVAQIAVGGIELLVGPNHAIPTEADPAMWGAFPNAPWVGRVRHGRFALDGRAHELEMPMPPHAIHGTVYRQPWQVDASDDTSVALSCAIGWEFGGAAEQRITLDEHALRCELTAQAGEVAMPVEIGWHPWFVKPARLTFTPDAMYRRDAEGIATTELTQPPPGPWDDCFINTEPVVLHYPEVAVTVVSDCDHWVIYDEPLHSTCVEPLSGPPDAFNIRPRLLEPGERLHRWYRLSWSW